MTYNGNDNRNGRPWYAERRRVHAQAAVLYKRRRYKGAATLGSEA